MPAGPLLDMLHIMIVLYEPEGMNIPKSAPRTLTFETVVLSEEICTPEHPQPWSKVNPVTFTQFDVISII